MMNMPVEGADFASEVAKSGLEGDSWQTHADPRGHQSVADGVLAMRIAAGQGACAVTRQTMQPLRNLGFDVSVQFRPGATQSAFRAGLGVTDSHATTYELCFDGSGYDLSRRVRGSALSSGLRGPLGDEASAWHTLRLRYVFDTGRLSFMLDDKVLDEQSVDLSDVRIGLFFDTQGQGAGSVEFRSFTYAP
jgi:hypothetical protein